VILVNLSLDFCFSRWTRIRTKPSTRVCIYLIMYRTTRSVLASTTHGLLATIVSRLYDWSYLCFVLLINHARAIRLDRIDCSQGIFAICATSLGFWVLHSRLKATQPRRVCLNLPPLRYCFCGYGCPVPLLFFLPDVFSRY